MQRTSDETSRVLAIDINHGRNFLRGHSARRGDPHWLERTQWPSSRLGNGEALLLTKPKTTPKVWEDCDVSPRNSGKIRKDNGVGKSVVFCIYEGTDERRVRHDGHGDGVVLRDGPHRVPAANIALGA